MDCVQDIRQDSQSPSEVQLELHTVPTGQVPQELHTVNPTLVADPVAREPLIVKLLGVIRLVPHVEWQAAALRFVRPTLKDRAVSLAFIEEIVRSLKELRPMDYGSLNSYMLTGSKRPECDCDPERVPNLGKCEHAWGSATDPSICHDWQFRAFLALSTDLSVIETCMIAAELTGDRSFVEDEKGEPYFGLATTFISYFWHAPFVTLADGAHTHT